jgi:hypothetical protein
MKKGRRYSFSLVIAFSHGVLLLREFFIEAPGLEVELNEDRLGCWRQLAASL